MAWTRGRLIITISDSDGNPIGFGGRLLELLLLAETSGALITTNHTTSKNVPETTRKNNINSNINSNSNSNSNSWINMHTSANAKYINSPETPLFKKGLVLFGLHQMISALNLKRKDSDLEDDPDGSESEVNPADTDNDSSGVIMVEGYFDVMSLVECGIRRVVSSMGTQISKEQVRYQLLLLYIAFIIILMVDLNQLMPWPMFLVGTSS